MGQKEMAINYRSRFAYRIDAWDADGETVIEHLAGDGIRKKLAAGVNVPFTEKPRQSWAKRG
jgi:hypothetical protein